MAVFRIEKTKNYTCMSNYHFAEKEMSLKAKGLLSLMLSLPDNWDYSIAGLVAICKENETAIKSTLKELQSFGYLQISKRMPNETSTGRIEYNYTIYEKSQKQEGKKQEVENLPLEILPLENRSQLNTKELNTKNKVLLDNKLSNKENFEKPDFNDIEKEVLEKKKQKQKAEKVKNAILINQMLDNFTSNDEVKGHLAIYLKNRRKRGLTPEQWKIILDDLRKECGTDKNYAIEKIQKAIAGNWMQIIYKSKSSFSSRPSFDNTANHVVPKGVASMTEEEKEYFIENELARDENGNFIKF